MSQPDEAIVFDVQRFSLHDGPGIRSVVFFKGCGLACVWCQNPEAIRAAPQLAYSAERCVEGCTRCLSLCQENALRDGRVQRVDFTRCTGCGDCVIDCPSAALRMIGRRTTVDALLEEVLRDRAFYEASGGGITLSGGEPVLQAAFLRAFLPTAKREGLHVVLETSGRYPFDLLEPLLPFLDLVLFDVKVTDPVAHRRLTGHDNVQILENLRALLTRGVPTQVRMPVVPGWNDDDANVAATARLLGELHAGELLLLPYNPLWEAKLPRIGARERALGLRPPDEASYAGLCQAFSAHGQMARLQGG